MRALVLSLLLLVPNCLTFADDDVRKGAEDDIRFAVFTHEFASHQCDTFFIGIRDVGPAKMLDPSDDFMKRFQPGNLSVQKSSANDLAKPKVERKKSVILWLDSIEWLSNTEAVVAGGGITNEGHFLSSSYSVQKASKGWVVTAAKTERLVASCSAE